MKKDNDMDLYRHIVHCHIALQLFLNYYFIYWCLVPMSNEEADRDDQRPAHERPQNFLSDCSSQPEYNQKEATKTTRSDDDVHWYIDHLPLPPMNYRFSQRQRQLQYYFFKIKLDLWPLPRQVDVYNATIVLAGKSFDT